MTNRLEHRFSIKHVTRTSDEDYVKALRIYNDTTPYEIKTPTNEISKRQTMRQSLKSTPPIIGDVASCIRPEDYLTMA